MGFKRNRRVHIGTIYIVMEFLKTVVHLSPDGSTVSAGHYNTIFY